MKLKYTEATAQFSECGKYRYLLTRVWNDKPAALCIGLNPSNANQIKDDPTINRLTATLDCLGYGTLKMMNLYALISSKPKALFEVADPLKNNDEWLLTTAYGVQRIIFCWGSFKGIDHRAKQVSKMFESAYCFGKNKNGSPWHPMAMMYAGMKYEEARLIPY